MKDKNLEDMQLRELYPDTKAWLELLGIVFAASASICLVSVLIISYFVGIDIFA